jgi:hypothetical protein
MTSAARPVIPPFQRELDPLLLMPVRLFVACLLADAKWCEHVTVRGALRLGERSLATHVDCLHTAGYLEIRTEGCRTKLRLTALGLDRLAEHVAALERVTSVAADVVAAARRACDCGYL